MTVTMKDIARLAGVSQQAVSAALSPSGTSKVSPAMRTRILKLAAEMNYSPNTAARRLKGGATKTIGIHGVPYSSILMQAFFLDLSLQFHRHGYNLLSCYGLDEPASRKAANELVAKGVDGIIFTTATLEPQEINGVPFVFCPPWESPGFDVIVDLKRGALDAAEHLIGHGRRRIGFAGIGQLAGCANGQKLAGLKSALDGHGLRLPEEAFFSFQECDCDADRVVERIRELHLDALCCANDYIAARLVQVLESHGLRVPDDVALTGYDGLTLCDFCSVPLATVVQPIRHQAELTVELMLQRIRGEKGKKEPMAIALAPHYRPSSSCGCSGSNRNELPRYETSGTIEQQQLIGNLGNPF